MSLCMLLSFHLLTVVVDWSIKEMSEECFEIGLCMALNEVSWVSFAMICSIQWAHIFFTIACGNVQGLELYFSELGWDK